ncbi:Origin of replication complex subunit 6 [Dimargaris verticillata]|uniref:Origin of replication complex subunit 6 n=1 Tax=Dimargaris verticillata TaxID=2761393 RepID=A0A9W8B2H9_9FUNG|nr:Origin of replication complex subunit 6 [Dimargaris verticillata]
MHRVTHQAVLQPWLEKLELAHLPQILGKCDTLMQQTDTLALQRLFKTSVTARALVCIQLACESVMATNLGGATLDEIDTGSLLEEVALDQLVKWSGLNKLQYLAIANQTKQHLGLAEAVTVEQLAVQFGCIQLIADAENVRAQFVERFLAQLPGAQAQQFDTSQAVLVRVGKAKIIQHCNTQLKPFNSYVQQFNCTVGDVLLQLKETPKTPRAKLMADKRGMTPKTVARMRNIATPAKMPIQRLSSAPTTPLSQRQSRKRKAIDSDDESVENEPLPSNRAGRNSSNPTLAYVEIRTPLTQVFEQVLIEEQQQRPTSKRARTQTSVKQATATANQQVGNPFVVSSTSAKPSYSQQLKLPPSVPAVTGITAMVSDADYRSSRNYRAYLAWKRQLVREASP